MRSFRVLALVTLLPSVALADREITPLVGLRQGPSVEFSSGIGCIALDGIRCPIFARSDGDSTALGFLVDLPIRDRLDFELLVNRQSTELVFHDGAGVVPLEPGRAGDDLEVTHVHVGARRSWDIGRLEPFGAIGAGFTMLESGRLPGGTVDLTRGSASLAGGARVRLSERLGLRLEARAYRVDLPDELAPFMTRMSAEKLDQTEITTGLAVRF